MTATLRIVLAQLNLRVGDIEGNTQKLIAAAQEARDQLHADVIVFPELSITGYPPEDLLLRKAFLEAAEQALNQFKAEVNGIYCLISHPAQSEKGLLNACSLIYNQKTLAFYAKKQLPNYGVFDECRYFIPGETTCVVPIKDIPVGIMICEDLWFNEPIQHTLAQGARLILSPNASPFEVNKHEERYLMLKKRVQNTQVPIVYVNNIGGQDDLIFDGGSMVVDQDGVICQHAGFFQEKLMPVDFTITDTTIHASKQTFTLQKKEETIYQALIQSVKDYTKYNQFSGAILGLSGGIDSALTLAIAVDALGSEHVKAFILPSRYTAEMSIEDAILIAKNLNVAYEIISIEPIYESFLQTLSLSPFFANKKHDVIEENLQSRCRGNLLMAFSNQFKQIVLTTGNRSELAMGYSTLYGDMAGGFCVLKDIPKTLVYQLARFRNQLSPVIPVRTIERAPTAELAPNQLDQDTLPPYDILDQILDLYLNLEQSISDIIAQGYPKEVVLNIVNAIYKNEYKRRQSPVGPRIHHKAFGRDRRYPITCGFKG